MTKRRKSPLDQAQAQTEDDVFKRSIILVLACLACYINCLGCGFVFDDTSAIRDNKDILPSSPLANIFHNDFWGIPMSKEQSHKSYRPLCVLSFRLNYSLHGLEPLGYHLLNLILHMIVTILFYNVSGNYVNAKTSYVASLLFAVHPIHTEAVTGAVGRAELLSAIFFLVTLHLYNKSQDSRNLLLVFMAAFLAMLSKEVGVTVIGLCYVHELLLKLNLHKYLLISIINPKLIEWRISFVTFTRLSLLTASLASLLLFRIWLMQGASLPVFTRFDNPASHADTVTKLLTFSYLPCFNTWLLLCPSQLCCDWTMGSIPLLQSATDLRNLSIIAASSILLLFIFTIMTSTDQCSKQILFSLAWMIIPFIPASNVFFPVGFVVAERILYIPSMGFCLIVSLGLQRIMKQCSNNIRNISQSLLYFLILSHSTKTIARNFDWVDEQSIFLSGLTVNQNNAKLYNNVGHALESNKKYQQALILFKEAAKVQPDDIGAHINIGRTLNFLERFIEAEIAYRCYLHSLHSSLNYLVFRSAQKLLPRALPGKKLITRIAPNSLNLFLNLGNLVARNSSRLEEADSLYRKAISMRSDYIQAYINRGDVLLRMNRSQEALNIYQEALKIDANNADVHYNLAVVALDQQKPELGMSHLDRALEINPNHPEALLNSAIVIQELGLNHLKVLAVERLLKLKELQPQNEKVFFNLGMLAADEESVFEAELWFRQAIKLKPDFRSALFNLALLLADSYRPIDALEILEQLLTYYPQHIKGLILLGDIYTNNKKDLDMAESCYKRYRSMI